MRVDPLEINGNVYQVKIHYETRNNSRISIGRKAINIRISNFLNREERFKELMKMKIWARNKLMENPDKFKQEAQKEYKNGEILKIGNEEYLLNIMLRDKQSSSARISENVISLTVSSNLAKEKQNNHVSTLLSRCIAAKRLPKLKEKIDELNNKHFNQKINKIFFKNTQSRWGSCSHAGNINISTRLLFAPDDILEYVCTHELAHLIERNHSERFWSLVEKAMSNYKEKEWWLKENGKNCRF